MVFINLFVRVGLPTWFLFYPPPYYATDVRIPPISMFKVSGLKFKAFQGVPHGTKSNIEL